MLFLERSCKKPPLDWANLAVSVERRASIFIIWWWGEVYPNESLKIQDVKLPSLHASLCPSSDHLESFDGVK